jgi:multidrug resistance efflux pump
VVSKQSYRKTIHEEDGMSAAVKIAKKVIHDKLESQIKTAEAKLDTLKAQAETAKADIEIKAIKALLTEMQAIVQKLRELKKSRGPAGRRRKPVAKHGSHTSRSL